VPLTEIGEDLRKIGNHGGEESNGGPGEETGAENTDSEC
jgi:hypothetical protein